MTLRLGTVRVLLGGKQITVDTHTQYAVYHHSQELPDTSHPSKVFVLSSFPLLMH